MSVNTILFFFFANGSAPVVVVTPTAGFQTVVFDVLHQYESGFVSVLSDVRTSEPPVLQYGITGTRAEDRIADTGSFTYALNNGAWNSGTQLGYYSPFHPSVRSGFGYGTPVSVRFTHAGRTYYKFLGKLANIAVTPGEHEDRMVRCTAYDLMDDFARIPPPEVRAHFGSTGPELITDLIDAIPSSLQPFLRDFDPGLDTFAMAFDTLNQESTTLRQAMHDVAMSDLSKIYIVGGEVLPGGVLRIRNRHHASYHKDVLFAVDDELARGGLVVSGTRDDIASVVQVIVPQVRLDTAPVVLYDIGSTSTKVPPHVTHDDIFGPYVDPLNSAVRVGGTDMIDPVAGTDYTMNTEPDGSGTDLTAEFTVLVNFEKADGATFTIHNKADVDGYITRLRVRGYGIYRSETMVSKAIPTNYGEQAIRIEMPYQDDVNVGLDAAAYLARLAEFPVPRARSVTFMANRSLAAMTAALALEPGARISVTESVSGFDAVECIIEGVRLEIHQGARTPILWCTWALSPATREDYWVLGIAGSSELGESTVLAF